MLEARSSRRIRRLNAELSITLRENESLIQQKEFLLREVNHRVQNSLALVASFLRMQGRGADPWSAPSWTRRKADCRPSAWSIAAFIRTTAPRSWTWRSIWTTCCAT